MRTLRSPSALFLVLSLLSLSRVGAAPLRGEASPPEEPPPDRVTLDRVGSGELVRRVDGELAPLPMLDLDVELQVAGIMVRGTIRQRFDNPTEDVIEAIYVFPLPERAAVHRMEMRIGPDRIVAVIQEKEEARRTFERAKQEGRKAALTEQQRPNLFTTSAANVNPGETVEIVLEYIQELPYDDGEFRLAFPLTFTPRYGAPEGGAAGRLAGGERPSPVAAHPRARVSARVRPGVPLEGGDLRSISHDVTTRWEGEELVVETRRETVAADRDFLLSWRPLRGWEPAAAVLAESRQDGDYLLLMLLPPREDTDAGWGLPTDTLFVVDVSGSMQGPSIVQARAALAGALARLRPEDAFAILAFDDEVVEYAAGFLPAAPDIVEDATRWVEDLRADGGTRIELALERAVALADGAPDRGAVRRIIFLTDGAVGNEEEILRRILRGRGAIRLHALGIGAAPNRYLLRKMVEHGRGLCEFIDIADGPDNRVDAFLTRLDRPVLSDLRLEWNGPAPDDLHPEVLPDLHAGEALFLSARMRPGEALASPRLVAETADGPLEMEFPLPAGVPEESGVAIRWARARVGSLMDALHAGADPGAVRGAVIDVSLAFGIVSPYTSLVAVEESSTARGDAVPVRMVPGSPGGLLPRGGTLDPMWLRLGVLLLAMGLAALAAQRLRASG